MGTANDFKKKYLGGRPKKMTEEVLTKLREAYLIGANDTQACLYANICYMTLNRFEQKNPWFSEQKLEWKNNPKLKAKQTLFTGLNDPDRALKYLELAQSDELSKLNKIGDPDGKPIVPSLNYLVPPDVKDNNSDPKTDI